MGESQYSFSLTTFSPSGKLVQIEYALNAVNAGATSLGLKATNGVVLATEKKLPSILVDEDTVQKISLLTPNVGVTYSGMGPDSRVLVRKARKQGQVYYRQYNEHIPVAQLVRETATVMQEFTRKFSFLATKSTENQNKTDGFIVGHWKGQSGLGPAILAVAAILHMRLPCLVGCIVLLVEPTIAMISSENVSRHERRIGCLRGHICIHFDDCMPGERFSTRSRQVAHANF